MLIALAGLAALITQPLRQKPAPRVEPQFGERPTLGPILGEAEARLREVGVSVYGLQQLDNPDLNREMQDLLTRLLEPLDDELQVDLVVLDSMVVNAYAFPGDLIVVNAGLIRAMEGPEELARGSGTRAGPPGLQRSHQSGLPAGRSGSASVRVGWNEKGRCSFSGFLAR